MSRFQPTSCSCAHRPETSTAASVAAWGLKSMTKLAELARRGLSESDSGQTAYNPDTNLTNLYSSTSPSVSPLGPPIASQATDLSSPCGIADSSLSGLNCTRPGPGSSHVALECVRSGQRRKLRAKRSGAQIWHEMLDWPV